MDDHGCSKFRNIVDAKADEKISIRLNETFKHQTTLHFAECKAKMLGNWTLEHLKLYILYCEMLSVST